MRDRSAAVRARVLVALADKQPGDELPDLESFHAARDAFARGGDPVSYLTLLDFLGEAFLAQEDLDRARELTHELLTIAPRTRQHGAYLRALNRHGRILLRQNHCYRAAGILSRALRLAVELQFGEEANALKALLGLAQVKAGVNLALRGSPETTSDAKALAESGLSRIVRAAGQAAEGHWPALQLGAELRLQQAVNLLAALNDEPIQLMAGSLPLLLRTEHPSGPEAPQLNRAGLETWLTQQLARITCSPLLSQYAMLRVIVARLVRDPGGSRI